jgi:hypothetical protein
MANQMIERVARAIYASNEVFQPSQKEGKDWRNFIGTAAAAIAIMREPTSDMIDAADNCDDGCPEPEGMGNAHGRTHWEAMIDAALK